MYKISGCIFFVIISCFIFTSHVTSLKCVVSCHKWRQNFLYSHPFHIQHSYFMSNICHIYKVSSCMCTCYSCLKSNAAYFTFCFAYFIYKFHVSYSHHMLYIWSLVFHVINGAKKIYIPIRFLFDFYILYLTSFAIYIKYHVACLHDIHIGCLLLHISCINFMSPLPITYCIFGI